MGGCQISRKKRWPLVMRRDEDYVVKRVMRMDVEVTKERKTEAEVDGQ